MLATGSPTVSADTVGQRIGDKGSKDEPKSPARSFFGSVSLQTLSKHLTRRGSSNKLAASAAAAAPSNGTTPPAAPAAAAATPDAADAQAAVEPSAAAAESSTPAGDTAEPTAQAAPAAPVSAGGSQSTADAQQEQHQQPAGVAPSAGPQLQASPGVVMTEAAVAAGAAVDAGSLTQTGKRKFLEGANSTELLYMAHAKSPAHTYDTAGPEQQQQDQQQAQSEPDASGKSQRDQAPQPQPQHTPEQQQQQQQPAPSKKQQQEEDESMPDVQEPEQPLPVQPKVEPATEEPSPFVIPARPSFEQQQQQAQGAPLPALQGPTVQHAEGLSAPQQQPAAQQLATLPTLHEQGQLPQLAQQGAAGSQGMVDSPKGVESPTAVRQQSSSPGPSSGSGGEMKPPSLVDMARRVLGRRPELFGPIDGAYGPAGGSPRASRLGPLRRSQSGNAAAAAAAGSSGGAGGLSSVSSLPLRTSSSQDVSMGPDGVVVPLAAVGSLHSEPSFNIGQQLIDRQLSSAASLENWLGSAASGSPRSMGAAAERQLLRRTSSGMSTGSGQQAEKGDRVGGFPRQNSFSLLGQAQGSSAAERGPLDKQASFAGWPDMAPGVAAAAAAAAGGSFSWPGLPAPMRTMSEDDLKLDIQMLPAVTPEHYPPEPPPGSAAAEHDGRLQAIHAQQQREQMLLEQHHIDRAFFAKVSAWEDELVDMLEGQAGPVAIRDIVSVFKDRIHSERDKSEFKALCDKWTGVVEYPAGSGVKCLAIKAWMRGTHVHHQHQHDETDSDDVGSWDDDLSSS